MRGEIILAGDGGEIRFKAVLMPESARRRWFLSEDDDVDLNRAMQSPLLDYCLLKRHGKAPQFLAKMPPGAQEIIWNKRRSIVGNRAAVRLTPPRGDLLKNTP